MGDIYTNPPQSRNEAILRATIDGTEYTAPPESRIEDLLLELKEAIEQGGGGGGTTVIANPTGEPTDDLNKVQIGSTIYDIPEGTEVEANPTDSASETLTKLKVDDIIYSVPSGGGGGGTSDYTELENKPEINGVTLAGNKSAADLGLVGAETGKGLSSNDYTNADKAIVDGVTAALADKVDKVAGKGLSTNDYTDTDKAIVDGVTSALSGKVDKVQGKGLSTNDFTDAAKDKLDGIASGAEVNVNADWNASSGDAQILNKPTLGTAAAKDTTASVTNGSTDPVTSGGVYSELTANYYNKTQIDEKEANFVQYGGAVTFANLPPLLAANVDKFYLVTDSFTTTSDFVVGAGVTMPADSHIAIINVGTEASPELKYDDFGGWIDISGKQDKLSAGTNIEISQQNVISSPKTYSTDDAAETTLDDADYIPFYDTSATAKRKTLWSNIKGKIKDYLFGFFSAGLINDNGYIKNQISGFSVEDSGTASANSVKEQVINYTENSVGSSVINMVTVNGSKYMEQTINAQANTDTTFTFTNAELTYASVLDIFAGCKTADYDIPTLKSKTLSVSGSTGTLTLVYNVPTAYALTVRVYIRG